MRNSAIVIPKQEKTKVQSKCRKLVKAYKFERSQQEITEVELNRAKIVMVDENGNMRRIPILAEH
ncbi:hypothetical protein BIY21_04800 [Vibrio ponticus]|uniref:Uncharacterized protein n=1 Tax=Vibrio ponticus TaxID=265668 RepID=A0A3N3DW80_9VIBR|nr:hypothetical protein [Vibrio ponticus]OLQ84848.1 hypothetical protein BIY21_04800 [Vibrio ponticus]ROV58438.1 hypothetical protein EGH82_18330 [Vibrio ponticus]